MNKYWLSRRLVRRKSGDGQDQNVTDGGESEANEGVCLSGCDQGEDGDGDGDDEEEAKRR